MPTYKNEQLNCELGTIAITRGTKFSINRGIIVRVEDSLGLMHWPELSDVVHVWQVRVLSSESTLCYFLPRKGELKNERIGLIPDQFLLALTPATGQMPLDFEVNAQALNQEPMAL